MDVVISNLRWWEKSVANYGTRTQMIRWMDTKVDLMKVILTAILTTILGKDNETRKVTMQYWMRLNLDHEGDNYENQSGELEINNRLDPPDCKLRTMLWINCNHWTGNMAMNRMHPIKMMLLKDNCGNRWRDSGFLSSPESENKAKRYSQQMRPL